MTHVGDVDHVLDLVAVEGQHAPQDVLKDVGAQIANVGIVIDGGPAAVQAHGGRV